jgi:hypothetical protein
MTPKYFNAYKEKQFYAKLKCIWKLLKLPLYSYIHCYVLRVHKQCRYKPIVVADSALGADGGNFGVWRPPHGPYLRPRPPHFPIGVNRPPLLDHAPENYYQLVSFDPSANRPTKRLRLFLRRPCNYIFFENDKSTDARQT